MTGIPLEAYDYVVNGKPALDWVIERQGVKTDKDSGIVNDTNDWAVETIGNDRRDIIGKGIYARGPVVRDGEVHVPDAPGFGFEIDWDFARRYAAK